MTDLEICKRIAEIEHGTAYVDCDDTGEFININHPRSDRGGEMYNPLTDKALCFELMVKYMRFFKIQSDENLTVIYVHDLEATSPQDLLCIVKDTDPQRAVCLAIIEAYGNKTTWLRDSNTKTNKGK